MALTHKEVPVRIIDNKKQLLCAKKIFIIKVFWYNHGVEEGSWKAEQDMRICYPHLFEV
jgi:hypothetical protein